MSYFKGRMVELGYLGAQSSLITEWAVAREFDFDSCCDDNMNYYNSRFRYRLVPASDIQGYTHALGVKVLRTFAPITSTETWQQLL